MSENVSVLAGAASNFAAFLAEEGWVAEPREPHSPYAVKVVVGDGDGVSGALVIYHSEKKGYSLVTQEVRREEHRAPLQQAWERFQAGGVGSPAAGDSDARGVSGPRGGRSPEEPTLSPAGVDIQATLFVDGSYVEGRASYGYVVVARGEAVAEASGDDVPPGWLQHNNVAGEMWAVVKALEYCAGRGWEAVVIAHDYEGLEAWATGRWRAQKPATRAYQQAVRDSDIEIQWVKVKAHTGVVWNERADALAAGALAAHPPGRQVASGSSAASPGDFLTGGLARLAALDAGLRFSETLRRDYQVNFDVLDGGRKLGGGTLYTDAKGGLKLFLQPNLPTATADRLRGLWEQRHVVGAEAEGATDPFRKTRHVAGVLGDYREERVSMGPLRDAFVDDLEALCATKGLDPMQAAALRRISAGVGSASDPSYDAIVADVERAASILRGTT